MLKKILLGVGSAIGAVVLAMGAWGLYMNGMPISAGTWGTMALVWAGCSFVLFRTARRTD